MEAPFVTFETKRSSHAKTLVLIALAVVGTLAGCYMVMNSGATHTDMVSEHDTHIHNLYKDWKAEHNKTFHGHEDKIRAKIFANTHKKIEEHNANPNHTWTMGLGPFSAMTAEEFEVMYFMNEDSLINAHKKEGVAHEEHIHSIHKNKTHFVEHNESHIHHNNNTKVVRKDISVTHANGTQNVHHHVAHINTHSDRTIFQHSESHVNHSGNTTKTHDHHYTVSHSSTHKVQKNDSHVITHNITHAYYHSGAHVIISHKVNTNNAEGEEITMHNETHIHSNGSKSHFNHTHQIIPKHDHVIFHNESHVVHANGTHNVHHNKTEWHHNGTIVIHETGFAVIKSSANVDWTAKGAIAPVRNQAQCGACYAFAAIAGADSARALAGQGIVGLSEQQILDCATGGPLNGCNGGNIPNTWDYIIKNGLQNNKEYAYVSGDRSTHACRTKGGPSKIRGYQKVSPANNVGATQSALLRSPLSIGLWVEGWQNYKGGVFNGCNVQQGMHAVQIVGIQDGVWKIKNSWGTGWGESGFIRLAPGNTCSITRDNMWATA